MSGRALRSRNEHGRVTQSQGPLPGEGTDDERASEHDAQVPNVDEVAQQLYEDLDEPGRRAPSPGQSFQEAIPRQ